MANARVKFYLWDCSKEEFDDLRQMLIETIAVEGYKLSGNIHIDDVEDRRKAQDAAYQGAERRTGKMQ